MAPAAGETDAVAEADRRDRPAARLSGRRSRRSGDEANVHEIERTGLLPAGLRDILPPAADQEAHVVERLIAQFASQGYARVKAPLVEFESGLTSGAGASVAPYTFRLMDPVSQRMMGVRADITPQIARIASTRLRNAPRPLRISYTGEVLRVKGTPLTPERQFAQVGVELIGHEGAAADTEAIGLAAEALRAVGIDELAVDVTIPPLIPALLDAHGFAPDRRGVLREALDHKDAAAVAALGGNAAAALETLLAATGPAAEALAALGGLDLPPQAARERDRVGEVVRRLRDRAPWLSLSLDPVENRGFEYHTGVSFTIYPVGIRGELACGGRYLTGYRSPAEAAGEPATGFTLYIDTILRALPEPVAANRVFVPAGTPAAVGQALRAEGRITVAGLDPVDDAAAEARRLGCTHIAENGGVRALS